MYIRESNKKKISSSPKKKKTKFLPELKPHEPSHGFRHFSAIQDLSDAQSELTIHSGRQFGGEPK